MLFFLDENLLVFLVTLIGRLKFADAAELFIWKYWTSLLILKKRRPMNTNPSEPTSFRIYNEFNSKI